MSKSRVLRRILAVPEAGKEILARADRRRVRAVRPADRVLAVERGRAVHLHAVLVPTSDPRNLRVLPRLGRLPGRGRPHRGGGAGGALHAQEARRRLSAHARRVLSARSWHHRRPSSTSSASTKSRSSSSTGCSKPTSRARREGCRSYLMAMPHLAERQAVDGRRHPRASSRATRARCCSASTTSRTPHRRSIRRRSSRRRSSRSTASANGRPRRSASAAAHELEMLRELRFPHSLGLLYSAFTYFTGFKRELRRIQGDGPGAVRRAELRADHQGAPRRDPRRRQPVDEHGVLHLPARR